ncbi:ADP-ribosylglycohydrolase family protein [Azospirillum sp.]|uniref:ADP-ribosylglycohydrolase family protein n=1 Tax=Azospirillum sp. TaxID=34012 RepID=UPI002D527352|nr:ADP-ribosylglycohydrolase family protein [Azospirillum sp.]HYF87126.1 ADP-ribosylglycohydrolase family protein [Azospirillum sp.]
MKGAIIGDIIGSVYERSNIKTKDFPLFATDADFTDDTVCTVALAECILDWGDPSAYLRRWGRRYPDAGYGDRFSEWLWAEQPEPYESFGNGAAMRVSPCAWLAPTTQEARSLARAVTQVTHNHPEGMKGALAVTDVIRLAQRGIRPEVIRARVTERYRYDLTCSVDDIRPSYAFDVTCQGTVPPAIVCALEATGFEDAIRNAISIGGDSDTLAAITGSIAEAMFGVPDALWVEAEAYLPDDILAVLERFSDALTGRFAGGANR